MDSEPVAGYEPEDTEVWNNMYHKWEDIISC